MPTLWTLIKIAARIEQTLAQHLVIAARQSALLEAASPLAPPPLDNQQVMQLLKISPRTLIRRRHDGTIPSTQIKGKFYYRESDIMELLKK